ncbi:MobF family relaxase [Novacetimonas hansenii]|uniref:MobF family relaxase n=1 Tax=Novacetimonas hansenii TaxID=436 RepID=UPI001EF030ED|nr:MobF family relaxase [Novacetimonas hansenii]
MLADAAVAQDIPGKTKRSATEAIGKIFEMDESRLPTRTELEAVLAGKTVSGGEIPTKKAERAVRRFTAVLGADAASLTNDQRENILSGRMADGQELSVSEYHERMDTSRARIGYVDFTFSAPKSVSVAWAFAPTEAERGIILQAHHDAIASTMQEVEKVIGRARKGDAGKDGWDPASIGWVSFDHYTARPTVEIIRTDDQGEVFTELHTLRQGGGRVPGDMQLHTHTAILNAALTDEGRMGGLWLDQLNGKVKEWGAVYQAHLATNLRKQGVDMVLDERTEMGRVAAIPESVCEQFSRRTLSGTAAARAYAAGQGLDWDTLDAKRKIGLIKQGVQDPRGAKSDDLTDMASWQHTAAEIGYKHRSVLRPDEIAPERERAERLEHAYEAAQHVFDKQLQQRASLDGSDARIAAAKGLIAAGIDTAADINAVTAAMSVCSLPVQKVSDLGGCQALRGVDPKSRGQFGIHVPAWDGCRTAVVACGAGIADLAIKCVGSEGHGALLQQFLGFGPVDQIGRHEGSGCADCQHVVRIGRGFSQAVDFHCQRVGQVIHPARGASIAGGSGLGRGRGSYTLRVVLRHHGHLGRKGLLKQVLTHGLGGGRGPGRACPIGQHQGAGVSGAS